MSDSIDPNPLPEPSDVEVSQADERDAALAAVIREQAHKAEMEARARKICIRRQGIGLRHLTLVLAMAISAWIWIWPPGFLRIAPPGPPPVEEEEATLRLVMYFQAQKIEQYLLDTGVCHSHSMTRAPLFEEWNTSGSRTVITAYWGEPGG